MTVYIDHLKPCMRNKHWRHYESCHMIADTEEELIEFARRMGLDIRWLQKSGKSDSHFVLSAGMRARAMKKGAIQLNIKEFVSVIQRKREQ